MTDRKNAMTAGESKIETTNPERPLIQETFREPSPGILGFAQRLGELVGKWLAQNREHRDGP